MGASLDWRHHFKVRCRTIIVADEATCSELKMDTYRSFKNIEQDHLLCRSMGSDCIGGRTVMPFEPANQHGNRILSKKYEESNVGLWNSTRGY